MAEDLHRRCDLLFPRSETLEPVRLAAVRRGISHLKIHTYAWESPAPTQVVEDRLVDEPDDRPTSSILENG